VARHPSSWLQRLPVGLAAVAAAGLVVVVGLAAAAGNPVATSPFEGGLGFGPPGQGASAPPPPLGDIRDPGEGGAWLGYLLLGLVLIAAVVLVVTVILITVRMLSGRHTGQIERRVLEPEEVARLAAPLPDVDLLGRDTPVSAAVQAGLVDVVSGHDVRAAIIGAWLRLEEAASEVGTPRKDTDAPGDLVQRLVATHPVRPSRLEELAELYRRARFSRVPLDERDRADAIRALSAVRSDLLDEPIAAGAKYGPAGGKWPTRWT
jgi:hypothetical protein